MCAEMFVLLHNLHLLTSSHQDGPDPKAGQMSVQLGRKDVYAPYWKSLEDTLHWLITLIFTFYEENLWFWSQCINSSVSKQEEWGNGNWINSTQHYLVYK